ncbi:hypothetical protein ACIFOE_25750 [Paenibacillus sp. NRS-1783]|uniref:hypothetical protein n=1 Tax=Paenibacillus sp. NRS-1783 TaxID=3233907 RepID=UPI003D2BED2F
MNSEIRKRLGLPEDPNISYVVSSDEIEVTDKNIYMLGIDRLAVEKDHVEVYLQEFKRMAKKGLRSRVWMTFQGWDHDPRELYQIKEVTTWVNRLIKNVPHLFYFLAKEGYTMRVIFMCYVYSVNRNGVTPEQAKVLTEKVTKSAVAFSKRSGDTILEQFKLAELILQELQYD